MARSNPSTTTDPTPAQSWRLEVMGVPRLTGAHGSWTLERKTAGLLTFLALEGEATRSRLAGLLWSDTDESRARANLRQCLYRLKTTVDGDIVRVGDTVTLESGVRVDAVQLESGSFLGDDGLALTLEHGLLEGLDFEDQPDFSDWLEVTRGRFSALHREALRRDLERLEGAAQHDPRAIVTALERAERWLAREPSAEEAYRAIMRLHAARGDRSAVLKAYQRCEQMLQRELGVMPGAETRALAQRLERGEVSAAQSAVRLPVSVLHPPRLIGRERELERMRFAWQNGQVVVIRGSPGIGKSRLMQEFIAAQGINHSPSEGRPGDAIAAYSTAARVYRRLLEQFPEVALEGWVRRELSRFLPELGDTPPPLLSESDRLRFLEAQAAVARAAAGAGLAAVVMDDLQFVDDASLEAWIYVYAQHWGRADGLRQIIAYRTGELSNRAETLIGRALQMGQAVDIHLEPLGEKQMGLLIESLKLPAHADNLGERLVRHAAGNPLFALETVRSLLEQDALQRPLERLPTPEVVRRVVQERLSRLPGDALKLAQVAAVAGTDFDYGLAARVRGLDALALVDEAAALESAQILIGNRFAHDLIFEATLDGIPHGIRVLLHGRVAAHLEALNLNPSRIAHHWLEAGAELSAAPHLLSAAQKARDSYAMSEAAEGFTRAAEILARAGRTAEAVEAFYGAAQQLAAFDAGQGLEVVIERMFTLAASERSNALAWLARMLRLNTMQHATSAETAARAALQHLETVEDDGLRAVALAGLAEALWRSQRYAEAVRVIQDVIALYERLGDPQGLADSEARLGIIHGDSEQHELARVHLERSVGLSSKLGNEFSLAKSRNMLGITLGRIGLVRDAFQQHLEVETICARLHGAEILTRMNLSNLAQRCFDLDRYDEALRRSAWSLELTQWDFGWARAYALTHQARVHLRLGALEETAELLEQIAQTPDLRPDMRFDSLLLHGRLHELNGNFEAAQGVFDEARNLEGVRRPFSQAELCIAAASCSNQHSTDQPYALALEACELTERHGLNGLGIAARTRLAQVLLSSGDPRTAATQIGLAAENLRRYDPNNFYRAEVWCTQYQVLQVLGDPTARSILETGVSWLLELVRSHVPPSHRASFLNRNPVNAAIISAARDTRLDVSGFQ